MPLPRHWKALSRDDLDHRRLSGAVAILPLAAIEQHGPHLPLGVDLDIMNFCLSRLEACMPPSLPALLLPVQAIGVSTEHTAFPGTLSLPVMVAIQAWIALGEAVHRAGCRRIVLLSSHGGNLAAMDIVALELRARLGVVAVTTAWSRFGLPPGLPQDPHDWHGGFAETSLMLAAKPDQVELARACDFPSRGATMASAFKHLGPAGRGDLAWMAQDLNSEGVMGNAAAASAAAGHSIADHLARALLELIEDVIAFEL